MPKISDYALLSGNVYEDVDTKIGLYKNIYLVDVNNFNKVMSSQQTGWARMQDVSPQMSPRQHFYSQLYIKFDNGKTTDAVIAIRGTVRSDENNIKVDIKSWLSDVMGDGRGANIPAYFPLAISFFHQSRAYLQQHFPHLSGKMHLTGHSLGGSLAKLMVLNAGIAIKTVAFNAPGVGHMPGVSHRLADMIENVNAIYGLINKVGESFGRIIYINVPEQSDAAKELFQQFDYSSYDKSKSDYRSGHNVKAFLERAKSLMHSNHTLESTKPYKLAYMDCMSDKASNLPHYPLSVGSDVISARNQGFFLMEEQASCKLHAMFDSYENIILSQHSITNMIRALQSPHYQSLALSDY